MSEALPEGLYDLLLTELLKARLPSDHALEAPLSQRAAADHFIEYVSEQLRLALDAMDTSGGDDHSSSLQHVALINALLVEIRKASMQGPMVDAVVAPVARLRSVGARYRGAALPDTGLRVPWLFSSNKGSPGLMSELRREIGSADRIDILMSFITMSGVRRLQEELTAVTAIDATGHTRARLRIVTTTYIGATEAKALDWLARLPGCEVRVSLDGQRTRLHAKAWIFERGSGFGTAYVGSANLTQAALMGGLEWTVRFTQRAQGAMFEQARAHFETLWADPEFRRYNPDDPAQRTALVQALRREGGVDSAPGVMTFFDFAPKKHQEQALAEIALERERGRTRNLVVAATGTGKTVIAALDYARNAVGRGRPRLLFVAHREQILKQAQDTYRQLLRDSTFGELLTGHLEPHSVDHLFATIYSVNSRNLVATYGAQYWHQVVIDECHHIAATSFSVFCAKVRPQFLLGLTATPERMDGKPVGEFFDQRPDGSAAYELRLWRALDQQLLVPFEYFACEDATDFRAVPWGEAQKEVVAIDALVTGNMVRAKLIVDEWTRLTDDPRRCKALAFCVSVDHAEFMATMFTRAGIPAQAVTSRSPQVDRQAAPQNLQTGAVAVLVTVDLYNEGVDLPFVDTLLFLRPTQSALVFQQQLGRGLRLCAGKSTCLVLDFVGQHREDFRFDRLLSGVTGLTRRELEDGLENGFSTLPAGCHIQLHRQARERILQSLKSFARLNWQRLTNELRSYAALKGSNDFSLTQFVIDQGLDIGEVYRASAPAGWTALRRAARLIASEPTADDAYLGRRYADLLHIDAPNLIEVLERCDAIARGTVTGSPDEPVLLQMITYQIDGEASRVGHYTDLLARLKTSPEMGRELTQLAHWLSARSRVRDVALPWPTFCPDSPHPPLRLHSHYKRREILTAVGYYSATARPRFGEGVLRLKDARVEVLFVTLDKREGFHDAIAFHDYAIDPTHFHWQTQSSAGPDTSAGRRYLDSPGNNWTFQLFVRKTKDDAFLACGPVQVVAHEGAKPINITLELSVALPHDVFAAFSVLRDA
jgi:superfamily II DNA or RNA helicase/HKD family nuclease